MAVYKEMPSREYLQKHFSYDSETGEFIKLSNNTRGTINKDGYLTINIHNIDKKGNSRYFVHRLIWKWMMGFEPNQIDHINGVPSDNKWDNLRNVDKKAIPEPRPVNKSGIYHKKLKPPGGKKHLGSHRINNRDRWEARVDGKFIGTFKCPTAAILARKKYIAQQST